MTYGKSLLSLWPLDPAAIYLNHGTVGVVPIRVAEAQQAWRERIERHPARFLLRELRRAADTGGPSPLRGAAADVAAFVGARADDLVFVDNTTAGVNAVLRSLTFGPDDEILVTDHLYGGLLAAVRYTARRSGVRVRVAEMPYPEFDAGAAVERIAAALTPQTRLAIVEHIAAESGLVFPVDRIVNTCRTAGVPVLVDGAHVPGQLALDISAIGADYYVANLHKWAMAPRSCGILVALPDRQADLHPPVVSWDLDAGFTREFDWMGTRDVTPWLTAPEGLRFLQALDYDGLRRYNHDLAWHAAQYLAGLWNTPLGFEEPAVGCMVSVMTPAAIGMTKDEATRLRDWLLFEREIEVQAHARAGRVWVRVAAQAYNERGDLEVLGRAVQEFAREAT